MEFSSIGTTGFLTASVERQWFRIFLMGVGHKPTQTKAAPPGQKPLGQKPPRRKTPFHLHKTNNKVTL